MNRISIILIIMLKGKKIVQLLKWNPQAINQCYFNSKSNLKDNQIYPKV
jgi:hypothetical protein